ncbi:MAG: type II toxin-antitoxin system VapC family toxin [bacterium]|jgi:predicted nucleic acid-binding protein
MTTQEAFATLARLKSLFNVLSETEEIYSLWEAIVNNYSINGKQAYDARLVAIMQVHGISSILTFNTSDFTCYADVKVVHPADVKTMK